MAGKPSDKSKWAKQMKAQEESKTDGAPPPDVDPTVEMDEGRKKAEAKIDAKAKARGKQQELPGMESKKIADVEDAAEKYADARDERMNCGKVEVDRLDKLVATMNKHNLTKYHRGPITVELKGGKVKAKVRIKDDGGDGAEE